MEVEAGCWQGVCHTGMAENLMGSKQNLRHFKTNFFLNSQFICLYVENSLQPYHSSLWQINCAVNPSLTMLPTSQTKTLILSASSSSPFRMKLPLPLTGIERTWWQVFYVLN